MGNKKNHLAIMFIFYCLWSLWVIMSLSGCTSGKATLLWNEIPGATSYNVYVSKSSGVTKFSGSKIRNATNPFTINQLEPGKTYYFVVTAVNAFSESQVSEEISFTVD